jgi:hypothetical protein
MQSTSDIALTVLSFGAGQDTIYLVDRLLYDKEFWQKHIKGRLIIVGSDTGDEHPHTYIAVEYARKAAENMGVHFAWITPDMGFHSPTWKSLTGQYKRNNNCGSAAFRQTCTDNLKVKVVDRYVEWYIGKHYLSLNGEWLDNRYMGSRKSNYYAFAEKFGYIRLILGFAAKEESRIANGNKFDPAWKKAVIRRYYPLIIDGTDRQDAINYNEYNISLKIWPSNCMRCFYSSDQEILWLYRNYPAKFQEWVLIERAKLTKDIDKDKNYGVYGKITLEQKLQKAQALYGHWTNEALNEYKFSHGHCIKSRY